MASLSGWLRVDQASITRRRSPGSPETCEAICDGSPVPPLISLDLWRVRAPPLPPVFARSASGERRLARRSPSSGEGGPARPLRTATRQASMNFACVYILQSLSSPEHFYAGFTEDLRAHACKGTTPAKCPTPPSSAPGASKPPSPLRTETAPCDLSVTSRLPPDARLPRNGYRWSARFASVDVVLQLAFLDAGAPANMNDPHPRSFPPQLPG
jgi:hypothetical protein